VNQTSGIIGPVVFGSLLDSVHYQLTFQKMNWGRNTWIQHRFLSNIQDLPIQNVKVCLMVFNWTDGTPQNEPLFQNRVRISPRVRGSQPQAVFSPNVSLPYAPVNSKGQGYKTYCVTVPWVKAAGSVKVNLLFSSNVCSKAIVWRGWVEYDNPFRAIYSTSPANCTAVPSPAANATSAINPVRVYGVSAAALSCHMSSSLLPSARQVFSFFSCFSTPPHSPTHHTDQ